MRKKSSKRRGGVMAALFLELASLIGLVAIAQPVWFVDTLQAQLQGNPQEPGQLPQVPTAAVESPANRSPSATPTVSPQSWQAPRADWPSLPASPAPAPLPGSHRPFYPVAVPMASPANLPDGHGNAHSSASGQSSPPVDSKSLGWLGDRARWATRPHFPAVPY